MPIVFPKQTGQLHVVLYDVNSQVVLQITAITCRLGEKGVIIAVELKKKCILKIIMSINLSLSHGHWAFNALLYPNRQSQSEFKGTLCFPNNTIKQNEILTAITGSWLLAVRTHKSVCS